MKFGQIFRHSTAWFWRALGRIDELDSVDRFIFLWISFNSAIRKDKESSSDRKLIKAFYEDEYWKDIFDKAKRDNNFNIYLKELKKLCPVENSKTKEQISITEDSLKEVINVIYLVRNNLFHGRKKPDDIDSRDFKLINASYRLLLQLMLQHLINQNFVELGTSSAEEISDGINMHKI